LSSPAVHADDAAISFRYAERIADGRGFTYNDHERVLGASNPLYTLALAALVSLSATADHAARALAVVTYVASAGLAFAIAARMGGPAGGALAAVLFCSNLFLRIQMSSGLEAGFAIAFGLGAIAAAAADRWWIAGAICGLALFNKLDAAALPVAIVAAEWIVRRRIRWPVIAGAAMVGVPWLLFAWLYFGSPWPNSLVVKLAGGEAMPFDPLWVWRFTVSPGQAPTLLLAVLAAAAFTSLPAGARVAMLSLAGWCVLHAIAYSSTDLGAPYPWYLTVVPATLSVIGGSVANVLLLAPSTRTRRLTRLTAWLVAGLAVSSGLLATRMTLATRHVVPVWELFDADRRLAGEFLRQYADPGEVVRTPHGWPAYASKLPVNDGSGLNTRTPIENTKYWVEQGSPHDTGSHAPGRPEGTVPLATFNLASGEFPGYSWFVIFGTPDSAIARSGRRALRLRLPELTRVNRAAGDPLTGFDLSIGPGASASFDIGSALPARVLFTPRCAQPGTASTTLSISVDDHRVFHETIACGDTRRHALPLPAATTAPRLLTFRADDADAIYGDVEVLLGDLALPIEKLEDARVVDLWKQRGR
ncbi:MAG TPA: hypothetical protein VFO19_13785, partial [Vicinamibacterales bacterium]|nr:hypothetical protein [Vicinamibacterales bacterium]